MACENCKFRLAVSVLVVSKEQKDKIVKKLEKLLDKAMVDEEAKAYIIHCMVQTDMIRKGEWR